MYEIKELTLEDLNLILQALQELPYKLTAPLIAKVQQQGTDQFEKQKPTP